MRYVYVVEVTQGQSSSKLQLTPYTSMRDWMAATGAKTCIDQLGKAITREVYCLPDGRKMRASVRTEEEAAPFILADEAVEQAFATSHPKWRAKAMADYIKEKTKK